MRTVTALSDISTDLVGNNYYTKGIGYWGYKKLVESYALDVKSIDYKRMDKYAICDPIFLIHDIIQLKMIIRSNNAG